MWYGFCVMKDDLVVFEDMVLVTLCLMRVRGGVKRICIVLDSRNDLELARLELYLFVVGAERAARMISR